MSANMARMLASDTGLSPTTPRDGLFEDARTRPQVPSAKVTRTPLTVTTLAMGWPRSVSPFSFRLKYSFVSASTTAYFLSSGHSGAMVGEPKVLGSPSYSDDRL